MRSRVLVGVGVIIGLLQAISGGPSTVWCGGALGAVAIGLSLEPHANTGLHKLDFPEVILDGGAGTLVDPASVLGTEAVYDCGKEQYISSQDGRGEL